MDLESKLVGEQIPNTPMVFSNALDTVGQESNLSEPPPEPPAEPPADPEPPVDPPVESSLPPVTPAGDAEPLVTPPVTPVTQTAAEKYADYSQPAMVLETMIQTGRLPEGIEIPKDMSWEGFMDTLQGNLATNFQGAIQEFMDGMGPEKEYIDFRLKGGSRETLDQVLDNAQLYALEIEGGTDEVEKNKSAIISRMYQLQGLDVETIPDLVETMQLKGKDTEEAKKAIEYLKSYDNQMMLHERTQKEQYDKQMLASKETQLNSMRDLIDKGAFGPVTLESDTDKQQLHRALFVPTEKYVYQDQQSGQNVTTRITKYQQKLNEFHSSTEQQLVFAKMLVDGFDLNTVKTQAVEKSESSLLDLLNAQTSQRAAPGRRTTPREPIDIPESKPVFEMDVGT